MPRLRSVAVALLLAAGIPACASAPKGARGPSGVARTQLWANVRAKCIDTPLAQQDRGTCKLSDPDRGIIVLQDQKAASHFLLIPSVPVSGIEDPQLEAGKLPNYWEAAWAARDNVSEAVGRPLARDAVGFAANPPFARTQDQLHIHIECLKADVAAELHALAPPPASISDRWGPQRIALHGAEYRVRFLKGRDLGGADPFRLLASSLLGPDDTMGNHTLVLVGTGSAETHDEGFFLLDANSDPAKGDPAVHGEDLLEIGCGK